MPFEEIPLIVTTNTTGTAAATSTRSVFGRLYAISWIDGTFTNGVDSTLSLVSRPFSAGDVNLVVLTDANDDADYMPRYPTHDSTGTALTYDSTEGVNDMFLLNGYLQLDVVDGGDTATGGMLVYIMTY